MTHPRFHTRSPVPTAHVPGPARHRPAQHRRKPSPTRVPASTPERLFQEVTRRTASGHRTEGHDRRLELRGVAPAPSRPASRASPDPDPRRTRGRASGHAPLPGRTQGPPPSRSPRLGRGLPRNTTPHPEAPYMRPGRHAQHQDTTPRGRSDPQLQDFSIRMYEDEHQAMLDTCEASPVPASRSSPRWYSRPPPWRRDGAGFGFRPSAAGSSIRRRPGGSENDPPPRDKGFEPRITITIHPLHFPGIRSAPQSGPGSKCPTSCGAACGASSPTASAPSPATRSCAPSRCRRSTAPEPRPMPRCLFLLALLLAPLPARADRHEAFSHPARGDTGPRCLLRPLRRHAPGPQLQRGRAARRLSRPHPLVARRGRARLLRGANTATSA